MRRWQLVRPLVAWAALAAAVAVGWLAVAGPGIAGADDAGEDETEPPAVESERGDTLYSVHCARCHAADGTGGADPTGIAPPLVGMEVARVDLALLTGRMPPARVDGSGRGRTWSDGERETLVAHLTELFDLEGQRPDPEPGDPAVGRELFATHCASCHGYTGAGGVAGGGAITPGLLELEPVVIAEAVRVGPFQMPRFAEQQISDEGVGDLVAYLEEILEEETTPLLGLGELHPVYLSGFVALLALAMLFSCMVIAGRVAMFPDPDLDPADPDGNPADPDGGAET